MHECTPHNPQIKQNTFISSLPMSGPGIWAARWISTKKILWRLLRKAKWILSCSPEKGKRVTRIAWISWKPIKVLLQYIGTCNCPWFARTSYINHHSIEFNIQTTDACFVHQMLSKPYTSFQNRIIGRRRLHNYSSGQTCRPTGKKTAHQFRWETLHVTWRALWTFLPLVLLILPLTLRALLHFSWFLYTRSLCKFIHKELHIQAQDQQTKIGCTAIVQ